MNHATATVTTATRSREVAARKLVKLYVERGGPDGRLISARITPRTERDLYTARQRLAALMERPVSQSVAVRYALALLADRLAAVTDVDHERGMVALHLR